MARLCFRLRVGTGDGMASRSIHLKGFDMLQAIEEGAAWYATRAEVQEHMKAGRVIYWLGKYRLTGMGYLSCR